ncbi:hypothetical protein NDU88_006187 [Pleurodeles waltl]|uniref:Uncharacterized protein n=1 Tax=Pleurodeles waltl TaxID=8319 RepID=A0AAV7LU45_PLEWA|nr:hypothetical protein NDU88_006187 [Pleurodeles waltl]
MAPRGERSEVRACGLLFFSARHGLARSGRSAWHGSRCCGRGGPRPRVQHANADTEEAWRSVAKPPTGGRLGPESAPPYCCLRTGNMRCYRWACGCGRRVLGPRVPHADVGAEGAQRSEAGPLGVGCCRAVRPAGSCEGDQVGLAGLTGHQGRKK